MTVVITNYGHKRVLKDTCSPGNLGPGVENPYCVPLMLRKRTQITKLRKILIEIMKIQPNIQIFRLKINCSPRVVDNLVLFYVNVVKFQNQKKHLRAPPFLPSCSTSSLPSHFPPGTLLPAVFPAWKTKQNISKAVFL